MANLKSQYDELALVEVEDDPVIPNAIAPKSRVITGKGLALGNRLR